MVRPISAKICRVRPLVNRMGTNTQTVVRVLAVIAPAIWRQP